MVTIKDVAKQAGVSVATVSRFLNGSGYVGEQAKKAIEEAVQQLNYAPNQIARSLSTKQAKTIGLIVPDIMNPFFPELARAIEDTALQQGYTVMLCNSDEDAQKEQHYIQTLQQTYIAGFIIATNGLHTNTYENLKVPTVLIDRFTEGDIPSVASQNEQGARLAAEYLLAKGAEHIGFISGPRELEPVQKRLQGFKEGLGDVQLAAFAESNFHFKEAEQVAIQMLQSNPHIDSVFASSDILAIGVLKAASALGLKVPEDLQVVGFDGISLGEMLTPTLTTIAQDIYALGEKATQMLIQQIHGEQLEAIHVNIAPKLVVRNSTKE